MRTSRMWHHYSSLRLLCSALPLLYSLYLVTLHGLGPVLIYANLPQDCLGQSEGSKELARKVSTNQRAKRNWRVNVGQSESLQERARTPANQSACKNRANADQSERREEPARKVSANPRAARNARERLPIRALAGPARMPTNQSACRNARESQRIRAPAGTARMPTNQSACRNVLRKDSSTYKMKATNTKNNRRSTEDLLIIVYAAPSNRVHRTSASVLRRHLTKSSKLICMLTFDIKWRNVFRHNFPPLQV